MSRINLGRVLMAGLLAGLVINVSETVLHTLVAGAAGEEEPRPAQPPPMADESHITSQGAAVKGGALLDRWADHDWRQGTRIGDLLPLDRLTVRTLNSTYELVVVTPGNAEVAVRGGAFFPSFARV